MSRAIEGPKIFRTIYRVYALGGAVMQTVPKVPETEVVESQAPGVYRGVQEANPRGGG